ncbi:MAG: outer membrane lipoprotein chaperone LolA [Gammaproteobacteria bacterium]|nr:outer membrane lipoprotein chaperone LolA [Gammaproteobacteria bacterium]
MRYPASCKSVTALLCASLLALFAGPAAFATDDAAGMDASVQGLDRLRTYLDQFESLRAKFRQEVVNRDMELVEQASGEVILKKPGRFVWNYEQPFERVIMSDGDKIWLYEADLEQVTVRRLDAGIGETPASLLTGTADVLDHFEYVDASAVEGLELIQLRPRSAESDFESIILGFDGDMLVQIALLDRLAQRTRLYLTEIERPTSVRAEDFVFVIPEGVDVIGETEL